METDFYAAMFPSYALHKVLGLGVVEVQGRTGQRRLKTIRTPSIYNAIVYFILALCTVSTISLTTIRIPASRLQNAFYWFAAFFYTHCNFMLVYSLVIPVNARRQHLLGAWQAMAKVDAQLSAGIRSGPNLSRANRRVRLYSWAWILVMSSINVWIHWEDKEVIRDKKYDRMDYISFVYCLTDFYKTCIDTTFWAWLMSLTLRLEIINDLLAAGPLDELQEIHAHICTVTRKLDRVYCHGLLVSISTDYCVIIFQLYKFAKSAFERRYSVQDTALPLIWMFYSVSGLIGMVLNAEMLKSQINQIKRGLLKVALAKGHDPQVRQDIRGFWHQLLFDDVEVTVGDVFTLDLSFVFAMIGAGTTYLVILIQFDLLKVETEEF